MQSEHPRNKHLSIRVTSDTIAWLRENKYSATAIFHEAVKEMGYKPKTSSK